MAKAKLFDQNGKPKEAIKLADGVFGVEPNSDLISQAVRVHLINARRGTRSTKGRSDLHYSNKKIYKQKHTGRARHGDRTANIFVHGAVAHGPKPYTPSADFPKKMKEVALKSALSFMAKEDAIMVIEKMSFDGKSATKKASTLIKKKLGLNKALIVPAAEEKLGLGIRNLASVKTKKANMLSTYDVSTASCLLFTKAGLEELVSRFSAKK